MLFKKFIGDYEHKIIDNTMVIVWGNYLFINLLSLIQGLYLAEEKVNIDKRIYDQLIDILKCNCYLKIYATGMCLSVSLTLR